MGIIIGITQGLLVFIGCVIAGHFFFIAFRILRRGNEWKDLCDTTEGIRTGRINLDDVRVGGKGIRYNERTGQLVVRARPRDYFFKRLLAP